MTIEVDPSDNYISEAGWYLISGIVDTSLGAVINTYKSDSVELKLDYAFIPRALFYKDVSSVGPVPAPGNFKSEDWIRIYENTILPHNLGIWIKMKTSNNESGNSY